jgi:hypothetical protein
MRTAQVQQNHQWQSCHTVSWSNENRPGATEPPMPELDTMSWSNENRPGAAEPPMAELDTMSWSNENRSGAAEPPMVELDTISWSNENRPGGALQLGHLSGAYIPESGWPSRLSTGLGLGIAQLHCLSD